MFATSAAFVVGSTEVTDPAAIASDAEQVPTTIARFGGRFRLAGPVTALEGDAPTFAAVIEFPDGVTAAAWYDSNEYAAIRGLRRASGTSAVWLVEPPIDAFTFTKKGSVSGRGVRGTKG